MSVLRQFIRPLLLTFAVTGLYAGVAIVVGMTGDESRAATTERVVTDRLTGLAIYGYDPVAYFTEDGPRQGSPSYELSWSGATWRFTNEGNRDAFMQDPSIYEPRYGAYDPVAVGAGLPAAGHPALYAIHRQRLYVFHSETNRDLFLQNPGEIIARAEGHWPEVKAKLVP